MSTWQTKQKKGTETEENTNMCPSRLFDFAIKQRKKQPKCSSVKVFYLPLHPA